MTEEKNTVISSHPVQNVQGNTGQSLLALPPHILLGEWKFLTTSHCSFPSFGLFLIQASGAFSSLRVNKVVKLIWHIMSYFKFLHCQCKLIFKCVKLMSDDGGVSLYWEKKRSYHRGTECWAEWNVHRLESNGNKIRKVSRTQIGMILEIILRSLDCLLIKMVNNKEFLVGEGHDLCCWKCRL